MVTKINIKEKVKELKSKLSALFLAYKREDTPLAAKIVAAITVVYALSPIDAFEFRLMFVTYTAL